MDWNLTDGRKLLIGMIHCLPLPGTYGATASIDEVIERAVSDAKTLERVGFDAVMVENEDLCLEPHMTKVQFAAISMVAQAVRSAVKLPLGLCCSALNYEEALSIAKVVGGDFIRSPIFVAVSFSDLVLRILFFSICSCWHFFIFFISFSVNLIYFFCPIRQFIN